MYTSNQLKPFVDQVNREAAEALQAVYKRNLPELMQRIKPKLQDNPGPEENNAYLRLIVGFQNPVPGFYPIPKFPSELEDI